MYQNFDIKTRLIQSRRRRGAPCQNHQPLSPQPRLIHCPPSRHHHYRAPLRTCTKTRSTLTPSGSYRNMGAQVLGSSPRRLQRTLFRAPDSLVPLSNSHFNVPVMKMYFPVTTWIDISSRLSAQRVLVPPKRWAPPTFFSARHLKLSGDRPSPYRPCCLA